MNLEEKIDQLNEFLDKLPPIVFHLCLFAAINFVVWFALMFLVSFFQWELMFFTMGDWHPLFRMMYFFAHTVMSIIICSIIYDW